MYSHVCVFSRNQVVQASRSSLSTQLLLNLWQFSILRSNEHDLTVRFTVANFDSASSFCLRMIYTVDVRWL